MLTLTTCSKRISGFDMAPPASALLPGAAVPVTGTFSLLDLGLLYFVNCFCLCWTSVETSYPIAWCILVSHILFLHFCI